MDFKLQYRLPNIFWCLGLWTKKHLFVILHTYSKCLIQMTQYHNNKEKNNESWSKIIILSCQNEIKNKMLKWTTLMYIYILPVHHCSILATSFLRRLKNNNIFTLQLSNPDSGAPGGQSNKSIYDRMDYVYFMNLVVHQLRAKTTLELIPHFECIIFQKDLHDVSNVSITSRNLWIKYDTGTILITSW